MMKTKLDKAEKQVLRDYDGDEFKSVLTPARRKSMKKIAEHAVKKDKRMQRNRRG